MLRAKAFLVTTDTQPAINSQVVPAPSLALPSHLQDWGKHYLRLHVGSPLPKELCRLSWFTSDFSWQCHCCPYRWAARCNSPSARQTPAASPHNPGSRPCQVIQLVWKHVWSADEHLYLLKEDISSHCHLLLPPAANAQMVLPEGAFSPSLAARALYQSCKFRSEDGEGAFLLLPSHRLPDSFLAFTGTHSSQISWF